MSGDKPPGQWASGPEDDFLALLGLTPFSSIPAPWFYCAELRPEGAWGCHPAEFSRVRLLVGLGSKFSILRYHEQRLTETIDVADRRLARTFASSFSPLQGSLNLKGLRWAFAAVNRRIEMEECDGGSSGPAPGAVVDGAPAPAPEHEERFRHRFWRVILAKAREAQAMEPLYIFERADNGHEVCVGACSGSLDAPVFYTPGF